MVSLLQYSLSRLLYLAGELTEDMPRRTLEVLLHTHDTVVDIAAVTCI